MYITYININNHICYHIYIYTKYVHICSYILLFFQKIIKRIRIFALFLSQNVKFKEIKKKLLLYNYNIIIIIYRSLYIIIYEQFFLIFVKKKQCKNYPFTLFLCFHYYIIIFLVPNSNFTKQKGIYGDMDIFHI